MGESFYTNEYADNIDSPLVISPKPELLKAVGAHTSDEGQYRYIANSQPNPDLNNGKVKKFLRKKSEQSEAPFYEHFKKSNSCKSCSKEYFKNISEYHRPIDGYPQPSFYKYIEPTQAMDGYTAIKPGSKTVVGCTKCRKGSQAIPGVTFVDTGNTIMKKEIQQDPSICNYGNDWQGSRYRTHDFCKKPVLSNNAVNFESFPELINKSKIDISNKGYWGPKFWDFLTTIAFSYPDNPSYEEKTAMLNLFLSLPQILPCKLCGEHCYENLIKSPPQVDNKDSLTRWLVNFHNMVNNELGKPSIDYDIVKAKYQNKMTCKH